MTQQTTLHLPIQRQWYELIKSGVKVEEYRQIKPHWIKRMFIFDDYEYFDIMEIKYQLCENIANGSMILQAEHKHFDTVTLRNDYGKNAPTMIVECLGITVGKGNPDWGAPDEQVFIIKLGNILKESNND
jgi:hypothetical protein